MPKVDLCQNAVLDHGLTSPYRPLDRSRSEIRLLEIFPCREKDATISCGLQTVSLNDGPEYIALSYVWGDPNDTDDIILNGATATVTKSLALMLRDVGNPVFPTAKSWRKSKGTLALLFWADGVCINQEDTTEKGHQVALMRLVYQRARGVVAWMGAGRWTDTRSHRGAPSDSIGSPKEGAEET